MSSKMFCDFNSLEDLLSVEFIPELIIFEANNSSDLYNAEILRNRFSYAELLIIANRRLWPEYYLNLNIRPIALLIKPYYKEKAISIIRQLIVYIYHKRERELGQRKLMVCSQNENFYFDYSCIQYIEARNKKVIIHYGGKEFCFYSALKRIETSLPTTFVRCHRSYIINTVYISRIDLLHNNAYIGEQIVVPFSKKYKQTLYNSMARICEETGIKIWENEIIEYSEVHDEENNTKMNG